MMPLQALVLLIGINSSGIADRKPMLLQNGLKECEYEKNTAIIFGSGYKQC